MAWQPEAGRYQAASFRRCGASGLVLPPLSLGLWQNFGGVDAFETGRAIVRHAFDRGITHFDLANNYGPPYGSAEANFGRMLALDLRPWRDELIISTKAGYDMWPGPYGDGGSRKYLLASLDASLKRLGVDYVDVFYHHRMDPQTPLAETMGALAQAVRQGKALYAGLSNYKPEQTRAAAALLQGMGVPCLVHQPRYSMLDRTIEAGLLDELGGTGIGCAVFSPLAQGLLTGKYLDAVPPGARMGRSASLPPERLTPALRETLRGLDAVARARGQSLAQMALAWVLRDARVTTALVGARTVEQLQHLLEHDRAGGIGPEALQQIDALLAG